MSKQCILLNNETHHLDWLLDPRGQLVLEPQRRAMVSGKEKQKNLYSDA